MAAALLPGLENENQALPELVAQVLPEGVRALIMTAIIAATMSTSSSFLAAASSLAVQDLYEPIFGEGASDEKKIFHSRVITAVFAAMSLGISLIFPGVVSLVVFATLVAPAAIFIPFIMSIFWDKTPAHAGFWAILVSAVAGCTSQIFWYEQVGGWLGSIHPLFVAPLAALAVMIPAAAIQQNVTETSNVQQHELDTSKASFDRAMTFLRAGDAQMAERICRQALDAFPRDANLLSLLGAAMLKQNRAEEAEHTLSRAVRMYPNFTRAHRDFGGCADHAGPFA